MMLCDRCEQKLIEIDRDGERLTGCLECNCWSSSRSAFTVQLSLEDFEALRGLGIWSASAFNSMMTHEKQWKL